MDFEAGYIEMKNKGYSDKKIAACLSISVSTLKRRKKKNGVEVRKVPMPNKQGITEDQLLKAESMGIKRKVVLLRVREYGCSIEDAIAIPEIPLNKRRSGGIKAF